MSVLAQPRIELKIYPPIIVSYITGVHFHVVCATDGSEFYLKFTGRQFNLPWLALHFKLQNKTYIDNDGLAFVISRILPVCMNTIAYLIHTWTVNLPKECMDQCLLASTGRAIE